MHKNFLVIGAFCGAVAVALGAFGAHGLQNIVSDEKVIHSFQTAVQYQVYHSLAIILTGIIFQNFPNKKILWAGVCFISGMILFSGSLYLLTYLKIQGSNLTSIVGPVTPIGGLLFIAGWILLAIGVAFKRN